jgi:hypothetical protein
MSVPQHDAIEEYLDALVVALRGRARRVRRILAEVEEHLQDAYDEGLGRGLAPQAAAEAAVERFGAPRLVAHDFNQRAPVEMKLMLREVFAALVFLGAVGLIAIGASGALSMGMRAAMGSRFIAGDTVGVRYTPARCEEYRQLRPEAPNCSAAASAHHADEVEQYRAAAGVVGVVALTAWWVLFGRRWRRGTLTGVLPSGFAATIGAAIFGLAGAGLAVQGVGQWVMVGRDYGPGQWLSGAVVSLAVALVFAGSLLRTLRRRGSALPAG